MHMITLLAALPRGCHLLSKACLLLVPLCKGWDCLLGHTSGKTTREAPGPLVLKVDIEGGQSHAQTSEAGFRRYMSGLYMGNEVASTVALNISHIAGGVGAVGVADLGKCATSAKWTRRNLMKLCTLPNHSEAGVPLLTKETMAEEYHVFAVLLPHELLVHFVKEDPNLLVPWSVKPTSTLHSAAFDWCQKFQVEHCKVLPLGLHGDAAPLAQR